MTTYLQNVQRSKKRENEDITSSPVKVSIDNKTDGNVDLRSQETTLAKFSAASKGNDVL